MAGFAEQDELKETVIEEGKKVLQGNHWCGLEQASLLLGHLEYKPVAGRIVELLDHERKEVYVTAAWALRRLQVPETLPRMLAKAQWHYERFVEPTIAVADGVWPSGRQCAQLFQAFGQMRYRESDELMRKCVPKNLNIDGEMRAAACWALGYLYEDNPEQALVAMFESRIEDFDSIPPEDENVLWMSAIALGRMRAESALPTLRRIASMHGPNREPGRACYWAIERITGEPAPPPEKSEVGVLGWFLEPIAD
ncbi:MAG: HEAT repeat domain-containing protein, partial [Pirellulaceae bacterium]